MKAGKRSRQQQEQPAPASLPDFEQWMRSVGITWDADLLALVASCPGCSGAAVGVQAVCNVSEGALLCTIPKTAILSRRTTSIADLLEAEKLGGGLALTIAAAHEAALGPASAWHGYLRSLPAREYLPLMWDDAQLGELQGTDLEGAPEQDRADTEDDYESHLVPLLHKYPAVMGGGSHISLDAFRAAASWVASRAFYVDAWHGDALVPLADAFNHKASLVELADGYVVGEQADAHDDNSDDSSDDSAEDSDQDSDVDEQAKSNEHPQNGLQHAGRLASGHAPCHSRDCNGDSHAAGEHQHEERRASEAAASGPSSDKLQWQGVGQEGGVRRPIISARAAGTWARHGVNLRLEIGICSVQHGDLDVLEIVAASDITKGNEIHNTYGEHGNAELVKKYGFALRPNPFDELTVDKQEVLDAVTSVVGERTVRRRSRFLLNQSELLSEDAEPFAVLPHGAINAPLFATLRTLCVPDAEFDSWHDVTDALGPAHNAATTSKQQEEQAGEHGECMADGAAEQVGCSRVEPEITEAGSGPGGRREGERRICGDAGLWCPAMVDVLRQVLRQRQGRHPAGSSAKRDVQELEALTSTSDRSEAATARRAALTLRLGERDMITAALHALEGGSTAAATAVKRGATNGIQDSNTKRLRQRRS